MRLIVALGVAIGLPERTLIDLRLLAQFHDIGKVGIVEAVLNDLKECRVVLGKHKKADVAEESRFAYKDIDFVIQNELDLMKPV